MDKMNLGCILTIYSSVVLFDGDQAKVSRSIGGGGGGGGDEWIINKQKKTPEPKSTYSPVDSSALCCCFFWCSLISALSISFPLSSFVFLLFCVFV